MPHNRYRGPPITLANMRENGVRSARKNVPHHHYSVSVKRVGDRNHLMWEIQRTPPLGVRLYGESFHSARAAKVDGERRCMAF
jgi:hypothetical protein